MPKTLSKDELQERARAKGLPVSGTCAELRQRLKMKPVKLQGKDCEGGKSSSTPKSAAAKKEATPKTAAAPKPKKDCGNGLGRDADGKCKCLLGPRLPNGKCPTKKPESEKGTRLAPRDDPVAYYVNGQRYVWGKDGKTVYMAMRKRKGLYGPFTFSWKKLSNKNAKEVSHLAKKAKKYYGQ